MNKMIIECINCTKKFSVNSELIPAQGRTIQCGSCNHIWFFDKNNQYPDKFLEEKSDNFEKIDEIINDSKKVDINITKKRKKKSILLLNNFFAYILVIIISLIGLIILVDTFKIPLYKIFPNLEIILFNLYETLKDIKLFIVDLF